MIASVPQFAAHLDERVKGMPAARPKGGPPKAMRNEATATTLAPSRTPLGQEPSKQGLWVLGDLQKAPGQTTPGQAMGAATSTSQEAFSRAWVNALEQTEATTAQRLHSTRGLALPLAGAKPAGQSPNNNGVSPGIFEDEKTDSLPLVLSLGAPAPPSIEQKNVQGFKGASAPISSVDREEPEDTPAGAPGELAFTAKIKSGEGAPGSDAPINMNAAAKPLSSSQPLDEGTSASTASAKPDLDAPPTSGVLSTPASNLGTPAASPKVLSPPPTEPIDSTLQATAPAPQPLKEIALQLPGARGVEVRLSEHAGEVRVDVRSGDAALTQDLRGNLHDLVSGLERKGFTAEVSHAAEHASAPASRPGDTGTSKDQTSGDQGGGFDRQPQQRNRQPGQQPEPTNSKARSAAWEEQASSSFGKENQ